MSAKKKKEKLDNQHLSRENVLISNLEKICKLQEEVLVGKNKILSY